MLKNISRILSVQILRSSSKINMLNSSFRTKITTKRDVKEPNHNWFRYYCSGTLTEIKYENICNETLESLSEYFEELVENCLELRDSDISFGDGVLTLNFGPKYGTYVINRQRPNLQIWLSSPTSGPKRYDYIDNKWIYKHDGMSLHQLLQDEISLIANKKIDLSNCSFAF